MFLTGNDSLPVVEIEPRHIALISAAIARVAGSENRNFRAENDPALEEIATAIGAEVSVYDRAERRYLVMMFSNAAVEICVGARPELVVADVPDDDPPGGTPGTTTEPIYAHG